MTDRPDRARQRPTPEALLASPAASAALKKTLAEWLASGRDPLALAHDAQLLAQALEAHADQALLEALANTGVATLTALPGSRR